MMVSIQFKPQSHICDIFSLFPSANHDISEIKVNDTFIDKSLLTPA